MAEFKIAWNYSERRNFYRAPADAGVIATTEIERVEQLEAETVRLQIESVERRERAEYERLHKKYGAGEA